MKHGKPGGWRNLVVCETWWFVEPCGFLETGGFLEPGGWLNLVVG
jgi:hypothetical protein